jgi:hypothetical protein
MRPSEALYGYRIPNAEWRRMAIFSWGIDKDGMGRSRCPFPNIAGKGIKKQ